MNYKIKVTPENREAIKDIAERNGMNEKGLDFSILNFYYEIEDNIFRCRHEEFTPKGTKELTFDQFKAMFDKQESLIGRYFKALETNAQDSEIIEGQFYKIEYENEERIFFKVLTYRDGSHTFILDKKHENIYYELMPIGFDQNKQENKGLNQNYLGAADKPQPNNIGSLQPKESQKIIHYIDAVDDIEVWNWFCENFDSKEYMNKMGNFPKNWKYFMMLDEGLKPIFLTQDVKDTESQKFVKLTLKQVKEKYMKTETKETENLTYTQAAKKDEMITNCEFTKKMRKETDLDKWLRETKSKNLSLQQLTDYIFALLNTNQKIYNQLQGAFSNVKAEILYNQWNEPKPQAKIIGYKAPFDMYEGGTIQKGNLFVKCHKDTYSCNGYVFPNEIVETWEPVFENTPTEPEKTFKDKVIEVIEKNKKDLIEARVAAECSENEEMEKKLKFCILNIISLLEKIKELN